VLEQCLLTMVGATGGTYGMTRSGLHMIGAIFGTIYIAETTAQLSMSAERSGENIAM
jgi:hypothetical protein